jgi:hypothetical protein
MGQNGKREEAGGESDRAMRQQDRERGGEGERERGRGGERERGREGEEGSCQEGREPM